jgi:hypothetical protein
VNTICKIVDPKIATKPYCIIDTDLLIAFNRSLLIATFFSSSLLTNPKIRYCPTAKIAPIIAKIAILESVELNPPVIAEILTIDVSTIKVIIMIEIRIKMPFDPIFDWNLFNSVMLPGLDGHRNT